MSLSGRLEEVPIVQVLQFAHLSGLTGTLTLSSGSGEARIGIYAGNIVSARCPKSKRLGTYLVALGAIDQKTLERALEQQKLELTAVPLAALLVRDGALPRAELVQAFRRQVEETIDEVITWQRGAFCFELDDLEPLDDIALSPTEVGTVNLSAQQTLLEAVRVLDERKRAVPGEAPIEPVDSARHSQRHAPMASEQPTTAASPYAFGLDTARALLLSADEGLAHDLALALSAEQVALAVCGLPEALADSAALCPTIVDVRHGQDPELLELVRTMAEARPERVLLAIVDAAVPMAQIYAAGATAVVTAEPEAIVACLRSLSLHGSSNARLRFADGLAAGLAKLRRLVDTVRAGVLSAAVPLDLLHLVSDSVERGVLLLVHPTELACLGAFGTGAGGQPLAEQVRGLRLARAECGVLEQCVQNGQARALDLAEAELPDKLMSRIGPPASGRCVVFAAAGSGQSIAVVYADNGDKDWPIEEVEFLELAAAQLGLAFENEQLRNRGTGAGS